ncbi:MAG: Gfo/Idh/MocA family oxidoreductase [Caldilineaceae bacterium]|nr:Gfo/Idh/MocA family oxidoreductase [Caldilineaceae bacterium]
MSTYRIGVIGFAHMHINSLLAQFAAHPQSVLVAGADTVPVRPDLGDVRSTRKWNMQNAVDKIGLPKLYDDYREMLEKEEFDIVITCAENAQHGDVAEACAAAGVHVVAEKPMAASLHEGLRMARAARAANTLMIINWPTTWSPEIHKAKALIDAGEIGRVLQVKWRGGHTGPLGPGVRHPGVVNQSEPLSGTVRGTTWWHQADAGGGAMLDYCCYGSKISRWFVGDQATGVVGLRANLDSPWGDAEDNAAMLVRFPHAYTICEGSWTTLDHGVTPGPIVYGTTGTLVIDSKGDKPHVRLERGAGQTTLFQGDPLPAGRSNIAEEVIHHLDTGEALHPTLDLDFNLEVMAILDAGLRSAASGQMEQVDNGVWRVG